MSDPRPVPHEETQARMVDITSKDKTDRAATASGLVRMSPETRALLREGQLPKGDALETARIAGIMGAKRTADLIPLCHPIAIGAVDVSFEDSPDGIAVLATVKTTDRTGVEMEALTAVSVACLTIYDMIKGVERGAEITDITLDAKSGGRSGDYRRT
jgi:cyclic pyranopterin monophosphate synthase